MIEVLKYIHQLPQNIAGFCLTRNPSHVETYVLANGDKVKVYFRSLMNSGVSLGDYIILDKIFLNVSRKALMNSVGHEHGHQKQSLYLGWLYLIAVGLPSAVRNIWDRLFHRKWSAWRRSVWYYGSYPENWADKLGGIER